MRDNRKVVKTFGEPHAGKPVAVLYDDGMLETRRVVSLHLFRKFQSYGISTWILEEAKAFGCIYIRIEEQGAHGTRTLRSDIHAWFGVGSKAYSWNGDDQRMLPVVQMEDERTLRPWRPGVIQGAQATF